MPVICPWTAEQEALLEPASPAMSAENRELWTQTDSRAHPGSDTLSNLGEAVHGIPTAAQPARGHLRS